MSEPTVDRMLCEGPVQFSFGQHATKKGFIVIYSTDSAGNPARVEVFNNRRSANKGRSIVHQILFTNVKGVVPAEIQGKPGIEITTQEGEQLRFTSTSDNNDEFLGYCTLLYKLPDHIIPEIPKRCLVSQQHIDQYNDPTKYDASGVWVVYLINEGVGPKLNFTGLHFVTTQATSLTFNIYSFYTGKHLMAWEHCNIRRSGCVGSLVFLEVGRRCEGGPGILWMYCPNHLATQFRESLHKFIHDSAKSCNFPIQVESISVDASLNSTYNTRQQLNLPPLENHGIQSPSAAKQQSNLKSNNENSFDSDHAVQDNGNFRQRTSVMSSAEGKRYKSIRCKTKNDNNTPPITSPNYDQHSCTVEITTTSSRGNHSDKPPPLPPKPVRSTKSNEDSSGFSRSVYECSKHNKSSSLLKDKVSVQPTASPLRRQQISVCRTTAKERYQVETAALQACSRIITDKLDVMIILPELNSHNLLTQKDQQFLNNKTHEDYDKIQYLLCCLPRKANGWFKKLLDCLHLTSASTGHGDIADSLSEKLRMLETQNGDDTALVSKPIQVSSMHDEDVRQPYTVFVDSPDTVKMLQVQSSESIRSLANKVRKEFCISPVKQLKLQVDDTHLCDSTQSSSLFESRINRYSYITVTVLDDIAS